MLDRMQNRIQCVQVKVVSAISLQQHKSCIHRKQPTATVFFLHNTLKILTKTCSCAQHVGIPTDKEGRKDGISDEGDGWLP